MALAFAVRAHWERAFRPPLRYGCFADTLKTERKRDREKERQGERFFVFLSISPPPALSIFFSVSSVPPW
jgi:hypothetical protein